MASELAKKYAKMYGGYVTPELLDRFAAEHVHSLWHGPEEAPEMLRDCIDDRGQKFRMTECPPYLPTRNYYRSTTCMGKSWTYLDELLGEESDEL